jgi:hypothetical protein
MDAQWVHPGNFLSGDVITRMAFQSLSGYQPPTGPSTPP